MREALLGVYGTARQWASDALSLAPESRGVEQQAALAFRNRVIPTLSEAKGRNLALKLKEL